MKAVVLPLFAAYLLALYARDSGGYFAAKATAEAIVDDVRGGSPSGASVEDDEFATGNANAPSVDEEVDDDGFGELDELEDFDDEVSYSDDAVVTGEIGKANMFIRFCTS